MYIPAAYPLEYQLVSNDNISCNMINENFQYTAMINLS